VISSVKNYRSGMNLPGNLWDVGSWTIVHVKFLSCRRDRSINRQTSRKGKSVAVFTCAQAISRNIFEEL